MIPPLDAHTSSMITTQSYQAQQPIEGVLYQPLKKHRSLEGSFMEHVRLTDGKITNIPLAFDVRQISISQAEPLRVNAFHIHHKDMQDELWCVIHGVLHVWLIDVRANSPTKNVQWQIILSGEEPGLLYIPTGVAHGYKAGREGATLLYAMSNQFNPADPNEGRLPWDYFGKELWEDERG